MHYIHAVRPFLHGLEDNWLWLMGLVLMVEPILDALWDDYRRRADSFISRKLRTRISWTIAISCAFVAVFLVFSDQVMRTNTAIGERDEARRVTSPIQQSTIDRMSADLVTARGQIDVQKHQIDQQQIEIASQKNEVVAAQQEISALRLKYARRHLTNDEKKIIAIVAKAADEPYLISVFQPSDCDDCNEYSTEFIETLTTPPTGWKVTSFATMHGGINPHFQGIALIVKDPKNPPKAALALGGALNSAKIKFRAGLAEAGFNIPDGGVGLVIGPRDEQ